MSFFQKLRDGFKSIVSKVISIGRNVLTSKVLDSESTNGLSSASNILKSFGTMAKLTGIKLPGQAGGMDVTLGDFQQVLKTVGPAVKTAAEALFTVMSATREKGDANAAMKEYSLNSGSDAISLSNDAAANSVPLLKTVLSQESETLLDQTAQTDPRRLVKGSVKDEIEMDGIQGKLTRVRKDLISLTPNSLISGDADVAVNGIIPIVEQALIIKEVNTANTNGIVIAPSDIAGVHTFAAATARAQNSVWIPGGADFVEKYQALSVNNSALYVSKQRTKVRVKIVGSAQLSDFGGIQMQFANDGVLGPRVQLLSATQALTAGQTTVVINFEVERTLGTRWDFAVFAGTPGAGTLTINVLPEPFELIRRLDATVAGTVQVTTLDYSINGIRTLAKASTRWMDLFGTLDRRDYDKNLSVEAIWNQRVPSSRELNELVCTYEAWGALNVPASTPVSKKYADIKVGLNLCWLTAFSEWLYVDGPLGGLSTDQIADVIQLFQDDVIHMDNGFMMSDGFGSFLYKQHGTISK